MLNPDGVVCGNYRRDAGGVDLNRVWHEPRRTEEPTIYHCKKLMESIDATPGRALAYFVDVHAHSATTSNFFIANDVPSRPDNDDFLKCERDVEEKV